MMRPLSARPLARFVGSRWVQRPGFGAARSFSSSIRRLQSEGEGERKWSTPLAKQLFEAISVRIQITNYMNQTDVVDNRPCSSGELHAHVLDGRSWRLLHRSHWRGTGSVWIKGRLCDITRDISDLWGTHWYLVSRGMDQPRSTQAGRAAHRGWARPRYSYGRHASGELKFVSYCQEKLLMCFQTIQRFPAMSNSIDAIYMVEASRELRDAQKQLLCGPDASSSESKAGFHSPSKYNGKQIVWTDTIKSIPIGKYRSSTYREL